MVVHLALGVESAGFGTRVGTLLVDAGQVLGALRADHTLRPALRWGAEVSNLATARGMSLHRSANAVRSAGIWFTHADGSHNWYPFATHEGITLKAARATARGKVVDHGALGICSTGSCAGIAAVLLDAGQ